MRRLEDAGGGGDSGGGDSGGIESLKEVLLCHSLNGCLIIALWLASWTVICEVKGQIPTRADSSFGISATNQV